MDFGLQIDTGLFSYRLLHILNESFNICSTATAGIDNKIGMFTGDHGITFS